MEAEVFENKKKLFNSAQANTAKSQTQRSITRRGVGLGAVSLCAESHFFVNIFAKSFKTGWINEEKKCQKISCHCIFKKYLRLNRGFCLPSLPFSRMG